MKYSIIMTETIPCEKSYLTAPGSLTIDEILKTMSIEEQIKYLICDEFEISERDLTGKNRELRFIMGRHLRRYLFSRILYFGPQRFPRMRKNREIFKYTYQEIANMTGCDIGNIFHSITEASNMIQTNHEYRAKYESIMNKLDKNLFL